jgi:hypothetical protein
VRKRRFSNNTKKQIQRRRRIQYFNRRKTLTNMQSGEKIE